VPESSITDQPAEVGPITPARRRLRRSVLISVAVVLVGAALVASGILAYINERDDRQHLSYVGTAGRGARIELTVRVQRVDVAGEEMTLSVLPSPRGALATDELAGEMAQTVRLYTPSLAQSSVTLEKGTIPALQQIDVPLSDGTPTDYPFDHYSADIVWAASADEGTPVPVVMDFENRDPFFSVHPRSAVAATQGILLETEIGRSRGTFILAWFMMAAMWAMSLAVLGGASVMARRRLGLVWPGMAWMAATVFALVGLRNAAPGSPPIGSIIDYAAFFWAEAVTVASVAWAAVAGLHVEHHRDDP
jgi:hypothetical protein